MSDRECFDSKLFTLLLLKNIKKVVLGTLIGAFIIGIPYLLSKTVIGTFNYRSEITVHVEYGEDSSGKMYDYINFYTWGQWIRSDRYIESLYRDYGMDISISEDRLKNALGAEVLADSRVVVFTVTTTNAGRTDMIASAVSDSITDFVYTIPEVKSAELLSVTPAVKYFVYKNIPQAFVFGGIMGLFVTLFGLFIIYILDDSVYIPELFEKAYRIPVGDETTGNEIRIERERPDLTDVKGPVTLVIRCGAHNGKILGYVIHECQKQNIEIKNARLEGLDEKLVNAYYKGTVFPGLFMNEREG